MRKIRLPGWFWCLFAILLSLFLIVPNWVLEIELLDRQVLFGIFFVGAIVLATDLNYFFKVLREERFVTQKLSILFRMVTPFWYIGCYIYYVLIIC